MSFRRPSIPKVSRRVPKPKKSLRKLRRKSKKPSRVLKLVPSSKLTHSKKKKPVRLGICYAGSKCIGKKLRVRCTKVKCKYLGGKSWKGSLGCEKIGEIKK